jgi:hypothetical protein
MSAFFFENVADAFYRDNALRKFFTKWELHAKEIVGDDSARALLGYESNAGKSDTVYDSESLADNDQLFGLLNLVEPLPASIFVIDHETEIYQKRKMLECSRKRKRRCTRELRQTFSVAKFRRRCNMSRLNIVFRSWHSRIQFEKVLSAKFFHRKLYSKAMKAFRANASGVLPSDEETEECRSDVGSEKSTKFAKPKSGPGYLELYKRKKMSLEKQ